MGKIKGFAFAVMTAALSIVPQVAYASTSIAGVTNATNGIQTLVQVGLVFIGAVLFGVAAWDYINHKHLMRALAEVGGGVIMVLVAFSAGTILSGWGLSAALLR